MADYDPITDDFMHPSAATQESLLVPPDQQTRKSYAKSEKKHKMRPKSAPKHRVSPSASKFDYPSNEDEGVEDFSEEELRLPDDDGSSAVSDQEYHQHNKNEKNKAKDDRTKPPANNAAAEKVIWFNSTHEKQANIPPSLDTTEFLKHKWISILIFGAW